MDGGDSEGRTMKHGRITRLFPSYGFLTDDDDPPCMFGGFFFSASDAAAFAQLQPGDRCTFEAVTPEPQRGPKALEVRRCK